MMKKYLQIYTGGVKGRRLTPAAMEKKLELRPDGPDGIIAGWSLEESVYRWLRAYTRKKGMELYLWLPVLSEYRSLKPFSPVRDVDGRLLSSSAFDGDEEFSFYCPGHGETKGYLEQIFEEHFEAVGFDGVFLDRLRFPSPSFDRNAVYTCGCDACLLEYAKHGVSAADIRLLREDIDRNRPAERFLGIETYVDGSYVFRDRRLENYFQARAERITGLAAGLSEYFRAKGLKVGMDLFAPCTALFVGQDYRKLSRYADFIKPMLYRYTDTPAGMRFELAGIAAALSEKGSHAKRLEYWMRTIGLKDSGISEFMIKELHTAERLSQCAVYAGMEIHTAEEKPKIRPEQIGEGVRLLEKEKAEGRIASWNVMAAEPENILAFMGGGKDEIQTGI